MSLSTPTTQGLADALVSKFNTAFSQTVPLLEKAALRVISKVTAGANVILYKYVGFMFLQQFAAHATMEETIINGRKIRPLLELGRRNGTGEPFAAQRAEVLLSVTVENQTGDLPSGSELVRSATNVIYRTSYAVTLNASTVQVKARAVTEGVIGNLTAGDELSFANPLPNVARVATVVSQTKAGTDAETTEHYRARVIKRDQRKPQGGAYSDYQLWGEEVAGIVNIYPYSGETATPPRPGEVDIYVEADEASSGSADGIPTAPQLAEVLLSIEAPNESGKPTRRPANAAPNVRAITRSAFDVTFTGLSPDSPELRTEVQDGVDEWLRSREPFIDGLSVLPRADRITQPAIGGIVEGIVSAAGATITSVALSSGQAYTLEHGEKAKLGTPTWA
jgi:uncharacterized phage protein gp47/JayE